MVYESQIEVTEDRKLKCKQCKFTTVFLTDMYKHLDEAKHDKMYINRVYLEDLYTPTYFFGIVINRAGRVYMGIVNIWKDWVYVTNAKVYNYFNHFWFPVDKQLLHASEVKKIVPYNEMNRNDEPKMSEKNFNQKRVIDYGK